MRHVANELRGGRIAPHDLRPLIPARRPLIAEEPAEEVVGAIATIETDHRADRAQLVWRVRLGRPGSVATCHELLPVALERALDGARDDLRHETELADRCHRDRR